MMSENVFESLKGIDVEKEKLVESKNGLRYISWAMAWSRLCDMYPDATMEKHCNEQGLPYFKDDQGWCFTKVTVTVKGKSITEILPVLPRVAKIRTVLSIETLFLGIRLMQYLMQ